MRHFFQKYIMPKMPLYAVLPAALSLLLYSLIYSVTMAFCQTLPHFDLTTDLDRLVPVIPGFVYIYFLYFPFCAVNYVIIARGEEKSRYQFTAANFIAALICLAVYVIFPTTNVRPEISGTSLADGLLRFVYDVDQAGNLFPSMHCLVSWFAVVGMRGRKDIPAWYRRFTGCFAILIMISTQVTKQHYIVDLVAGVLLAEGCFFIGRKSRLWIPVRCFFRGMGRWIGDRLGCHKNRREGRDHVAE